MTLIDTDVNKALLVINRIIKLAAPGMKKITRPNKNREQGWFDSECRNFRKKLRKALRLFRRSLTNDDRFNYCKIRREYKNLLIVKKKLYNNLMIKKLVDSIKEHETFWKNIKGMISKRNIVKNNISINDWFTHFKLLLEGNGEHDGNFDGNLEWEDLFEG